MPLDAPKWYRQENGTKFRLECALLRCKAAIWSIIHRFWQPFPSFSTSAVYRRLTYVNGSVPMNTEAWLYRFVWSTTMDLQDFCTRNWGIITQSATKHHIQSYLCFRRNLLLKKGSGIVWNRTRSRIVYLLSPQLVSQVLTMSHQQVRSAFYTHKWTVAENWTLKKSPHLSKEIVCPTCLFGE